MNTSKFGTIAKDYILPSAILAQWILNTFLDINRVHFFGDIPEQAVTILQKGRERLEQGARGVAITYSANYGQTHTIAETYRQGGWYTGTNGANQAAVMHAMEVLMNRPAYRDLQGKVRIAPVTTMDGGPAHGDWDQVHLEIVKADLARIRAYLEDGWDILGWQNQDTVNDPDHPYAIGGGIVTLKPPISAEIQKTLIRFAKDYPE